MLAYNCSIFPSVILPFIILKMVEGIVSAKYGEVFFILVREEE
jgi:hypothetical protein